MIVADRSAREGFVYEGFLLNNEYGHDYYLLPTLDDCQELCNVTEHCHYFNYDTNQINCYLKYGMGIKKLENHAQNYFGFKYGTGSKKIFRSVNKNNIVTFGGLVGG